MMAMPCRSACQICPNLHSLRCNKPGEASWPLLGRSQLPLSAVTRWHALRVLELGHGVSLNHTGILEEALERLEESSLHVLKIQYLEPERMVRTELP